MYNLEKGQVLGKEGESTDYFIANNITVEGYTAPYGNPVAITIAGTVNLYFEAKDTADLTGPTLNVYGGEGESDNVVKVNYASGPAIEVPQASTLRVYGRGTINAEAGSV